MFGAFLKERRAAKGQTQAQAAAEVGVHSVTWSGWERGLRPDRDKIFKVADWAGCSVDELRHMLEDVA